MWRFGDLIVLSLWFDGIVTGWVCSTTLEVFTVHLPGLPEPYRNFRFPITAILKIFVSRNPLWTTSAELLLTMLLT